MKTILTGVGNFFTSVGSLPKTITNKTKTKIADEIADRLTEEITKVLEDEGFDVDISIKMNIKKH